MVYFDQQFLADNSYHGIKVKDHIYIDHCGHNGLSIVAFRAGRDDV